MVRALAADDGWLISICNFDCFRALGFALWALPHLFGPDLLHATSVGMPWGHHFFTWGKSCWKCQEGLQLLTTVPILISILGKVESQSKTGKFKTYIFLFSQEGLDRQNFDFKTCRSHFQLWALTDLFLSCFITVLLWWEIGFGHDLIWPHQNPTYLLLYL